MRVIKYNLHYTVNWGDTLESIAERFSLDVDMLQSYNNLDEFYVGRILSIPKEVIVHGQTIERTLEYFLLRHFSKKHLFRFMGREKE